MIKAPHPVKLTVALTDRCNLKCFICTREEFEGASGSIGRNMALEDFYKMEDALAEAEVGLHYVVHRDNLTEMSDFVRLGKSVDAGKVEFVVADIALSAGDGVWIAGLPETATFITVGQGFVTSGSVVDTVPENDIETAVARKTIGASKNNASN